MLFLACNILIASPARSLSWQEKEKEESNEVPCAVQKISCPQPNSARWRRFLPLVLCLIFSAFCRIFFSLFLLSLEKPTPPSLAAWVTEAEKSAQCQQEFSPAAGT